MPAWDEERLRLAPRERHYVRFAMRVCAGRGCICGCAKGCQILGSLTDICRGRGLPARLPRRIVVVLQHVLAGGSTVGMHPACPREPCCRRGEALLKRQEGTSRSSMGMPESWRANKWLSILFANRLLSQRL